MDQSLAPPAGFPYDHAPTEIIALTQFLDIQRLEFHERAWGLSAEHMNQTTAASTLTLGGLVKHMALVESSWFDHRFLGNDPIEPWASAPWDEDPDWELNTAHEDTPAALFTLFVTACARSQAIVANAESLDQHSAKTDHDDKPWNLRWIMVHMIEEYARHLGHADLIRESIDGKRG